MPYKNKADRKKQKNPPVGSPAHERRMERQRLRRKVESSSKDANKNGIADKREGRDLAHNVALAKGGSNKDGYTIQSKKKNRTAGGRISKGKIA